MGVELEAAADSASADPIPEGDTGPEIGGPPRGNPLMFFFLFGNKAFLVTVFLLNDSPGSSTLLRPLLLLARVSNVIDFVFHNNEVTLECRFGFSTMYKATPADQTGGAM